MRRAEADVIDPLRTAPCFEWRDTFERWHSGVVCVLLASLCLGAGALFGPASGAWSAGALLVGGALIGVPHGGTDFIVAHRLLAPRYGASWLPVFVSAYLSVVCVVLAGWAYMPVATLLVFLAASALHFGRREGRSRPVIVTVAAATTPVLPIFMVHPHEVGPVLAAMVGGSDRGAIAALEGLSTLAFWPWAAIIVAAVAWQWLARRSAVEWVLDTAELGSLSLSAIVLPPFLTFGLYFCLLHSVRHMSDLSSRTHPRAPARAILFATSIIVPFAAVCSLTLVLLWDALAGTLRTPALVCGALQLLAALTVPHMLLELFFTRSRMVRDTRSAPEWAQAGPVTLLGLARHADRLG